MNDALLKKRNVLKELQTVPGVGKSISNDLWNIGIRSIKDLARKSPTLLYEKLSQFRGIRQDMCVLYTFRCAVYFASETRPQKKKLKWWYWKDKTYID
jgi:Pathogenicity locus